MKHIATLAAIVVLAGLSACTPQEQQALVEAVRIQQHQVAPAAADPVVVKVVTDGLQLADVPDEPATATYTLTPYCDGATQRMSVSITGYELGTVAYVTLGGAPPLHLEAGWIESADVEWHGDAYGIYIRTPDGTVLTDVTEAWSGC